MYNTNFKTSKMTTTSPERPAPTFELWLVWIKGQRQCLTLLNECNDAISEVYKHLENIKN